MAKKEEVKIITKEVLDNIKPLRGRVFKEFMKMSGEEDEGSDRIFEVFVKESLNGAGVEIDNPYDDLSLQEFSEVLAKVMEINNMEELFQTIERLSRYTPK